ncbi:MAG: sigma-54-dependent Fis family transcriptional regulator [Spirochaetaceae bacterium]|nr:MAG: sigma-54-dependent Fis family transcriptional regulator [Spirochaetaceae bacterium]
MSRESVVDRHTVLVVDDNASNRRVLRDRIESRGLAVTEAADGRQALDSIRKSRPDVVLLDLVMPGLRGEEVLAELRADGELRDVAVIVVTAVDELESAVRCLEKGAVDYLVKPVKPALLAARLDACFERAQWRTREKQYLSEIEDANAQLERRVTERTAELERALSEVTRLTGKLEQENMYLREEIELTQGVAGIVGRSGAVLSMLAAVRQVAASDATVLVSGETGTGKELVARAVHGSGSRSDRALIKVNCAALPAELIESELFGHEKGAFTGAHARHTGRFELADGGTIFLDEIAELTPALQARLLRVLEDGEFERVGGERSLRVDVRVIAATNRDLAAEVRTGAFREDLYYRLNVFPIACPALRDRTGDVPLLARHFLTRRAAESAKRPLKIPDDAMLRLEQYHWPGNVRELKNIIERAVIVSSGPDLEIPDPIGCGPAPDLPPKGASATLAECEREHIVAVMERTRWKVRGADGAAAVLGLKPTTLEAKMERLGIRRPGG